MQCTLKVASAHPAELPMHMKGEHVLDRIAATVGPMLPDATIQNGRPVRKCGTAEIFAPIIADVLRIRTMDSLAGKCVNIITSQGKRNCLPAGSEGRQDTKRSAQVPVTSQMTSPISSRKSMG